MRFKRCLQFFLYSLLILVLLSFSGVVYAADSYYDVKPDNYISWTSLPTVETDDSRGYYHLADMSSYGANMTTDFTLGSDYDSLYFAIANRVSYQKRFRISYGTEINIVGATKDEGSGGLNTSNNARVCWNVIEWDASGGFLWDSGWLYSNQTYKVGVDICGAGTGYTAGSRSEVTYITLLFRYIEEEDLSFGADSPNITPSEVIHTFSNLYLCYKPFTYTVIHNDNTTTINRVGMATMDLAFPDLTEKAGYRSGWRITSNGTVSPDYNWMNGNIYSSSQINKWLSDGKFYNSLFDHVTFTSVYVPLTYTVTYDYWTNGGTGVSTSQKSFDYGEIVDLSVKASKSGTGLTGWQFVGWSTDPDATTKLTSLTIGDEDIVLYAIYKKEIVVTVTERTASGTVMRKLSKTIYNREEEADFTFSEENTWTDWTLLGWTPEKSATASPVVRCDEIYTTSDSTALYAVYASNITLSYDTDDSSTKIDTQTKECFYNASGSSLYPAFVIAAAPVLSEHSFVEWSTEDGTSYVAGESVIFKENTMLTAVWDQYPELEVCDRYFTLEQAKGGEITQEELLKKVVGTDKEDGVLVNGTDVIVKEYNATTFTSIATDKEIEITYQATDCFGNKVTKSTTIIVIDTSLKKSTRKLYVRFINSQFFGDDAGHLVPASKGGLEETSIWRKDSNYRKLLQDTLSNHKANREVWIFTSKDIRKLKDYTSTYGQVINALKAFYELFGGCKQN